MGGIAIVRIDMECSCGAKLTISYGDERSYGRISQESQRAIALVDQFRKDHKPCRTAQPPRESAE